MPLPRTPLLTARLLLRPYEPADAPAFFELLHRNRLRLAASFPDRVAAVRKLADADLQLRRFTADWHLGRFYVLGLWHRQTLSYLGDICLMPQGQHAEIGYYLTHEAQGQGYAREALEATCTFGFDTVKTTRLLIRCFADNVAGQAVALATGFQIEGSTSRFAWFRDTLGGNNIRRYWRTAP